VRQDFQYRTVFCQIYGLAISKCDRRDDIAFFNEQIGFILASETHPHHNFARVSGYSMVELERTQFLAPTARNYMRHMFHAAHSGTLAELMAALYPCPLTYWEIGLRLKDEVKPDDSHLFKQWIDFYADPAVADINHRYADLIDCLAERAGKDELLRMEDHFMTSCQVEHMFWSMAYSLEDWPV